jgi:hypothetical protein
MPSSRADRATVKIVPLLLISIAWGAARLSLSTVDAPLSLLHVSLSLK